MHHACNTMATCPEATALSGEGPLCKLALVESGEAPEPLGIGAQESSASSARVPKGAQSPRGIPLPGCGLCFRQPQRLRGQTADTLATWDGKHSTLFNVLHTQRSAGSPREQRANDNGASTCWPPSALELSCSALAVCLGLCCHTCIHPLEYAESPVDAAMTGTP